MPSRNDSFNPPGQPAKPSPSEENEGAWIPYQVNFSTSNTGKHLAKTKRRVKWQFGFMSPMFLANNPYASGADCRCSEHEIQLIWSVASRKRSILVDNTEVHYSIAPQKFPPSACPKFEQSFSIPLHIIPGYHEAHIIAHATVPLGHDVHFKQFDLLIDGLSFDDFLKIYQLGTPHMRDAYEAHGRHVLTSTEVESYRYSSRKKHSARRILNQPTTLAHPREEKGGVSHHIDVIYDHQTPRNRTEEKHMVDIAKKQSLRDVMKEERDTVNSEHQNSRNGRPSEAARDGSSSDPFTPNAAILYSSLPSPKRSDSQQNALLFPNSSTANTSTSFFNDSAGLPEATSSPNNATNTSFYRVPNLGLNTTTQTEENTTFNFQTRPVDGNGNVEYDLESQSLPPVAQMQHYHHHHQQQQPQMGYTFPSSYSVTPSSKPTSMPTATNSMTPHGPNNPPPIDLPRGFNPVPTYTPQRFNSVPPTYQSPLQTAPRSTSLFCSPPPPTWEETIRTNFMTPAWDSASTADTASVVTPPQRQEQQHQQPQSAQPHY